MKLFIALLFALIVASALLFDWGPLWRAWRGPLAVRSAGSWLGGMDEPHGPLQRVGLQLSGLVSQYLVALLIVYAIPRHVRRMADSLSRGGRAIARCFAVGLLYALHVIKGEDVSAGQLAEEACHVEPRS